MRLGFTEVHAQESGRHQQEREFVSLDQLCVLRRFQRVGIRDNSHTFDERIPERDGRSEGVKKRQRREDGVGLLCIQQLPKLRYISDNVTVTDHNALWFSGCSARKQQYCFAVAAFVWNLQETQKQTCRNQNRHDPPENDLAFY